MSNVLITGCSSGFGLLTARTFARNGHRVFATVRDQARAGDLEAARNAEGLPITILQLDVRDSASVQSAVSTALDAGPLDVLVNNAGYALTGAVEEVDDAQMLAQVDTNLFGVVRMVRAVAPGMRERGAGTIVNVSTMAVYGVPPFSGLYAGTKAALGALSEALYKELAPFGVRVILVEPGGYATRFVANLERGCNDSPASPYHAAYEGFLAVLEKASANSASDPQQVADAIYAAATEAAPAFRNPVGAFARAGGAGMDRLIAAYRTGKVVSLTDAITHVLDAATPV